METIWRQASIRFWLVFPAPALAIPQSYQSPLASCRGRSQISFPYAFASRAYLRRYPSAAPDRILGAEYPLGIQVTTRQAPRLSATSAKVRVQAQSLMSQRTNT